LIDESAPAPDQAALLIAASGLRFTASGIETVILGG
jgi:hypothetical protein